MITVATEITSERASEIVTEIGSPKSPLELAAQRVDSALEHASALTGEAREKALELKQALEEFHQLGLRRIVQHLKSDPQGKQILFTLIDEPEIYALLAMHKLVRPDIVTRVRTVIDRIRPYVQSHGGDVELVEVTSTIASVQLSGACNGCSATASSLRTGIEEAIIEGVPEITEVKVITAQVSAPIITIEALLSSAKKEKWTPGPSIGELHEGQLLRFDLEHDKDHNPADSLLFVRVGESIQAFENACAHQGLPLERGIFDPEAGTITCPWHGFRFDCLSGECLTAPQAQLKIIPVRVVEGIIEVKLP